MTAPVPPGSPSAIRIAASAADGPSASISTISAPDWIALSRVAAELEVILEGNASLTISANSARRADEAAIACTLNGLSPRAFIAVLLPRASRGVAIVLPGRSCFQLYRDFGRCSRSQQVYFCVFAGFGCSQYLLHGIGVCDWLSLELN